MIDGGATALGFFADFIFLQAPAQQMLPLIEEKMRGLAKMATPIEEQTMMRENGAALLTHLGHDFLAERALALPTNLISIVAIDNFRALFSPPFVASTDLLLAFHLDTITPAALQLPDGELLAVTRITGFIAADKQELKALAKQRKEAARSDHRAIGLQKGYFFCERRSSHEEIWGWTAKGLKMRALLEVFWKERHPLGNYCHYPTRAALLLACFKEHCDFTEREWQKDKSPLMRLTSLLHLDDSSSSWQQWGMCTVSPFTSDITHIFCRDNQLESELYSSLQFIEQTAMMFNLEGRWYFRSLPIELNDKQQGKKGNEKLVWARSQRLAAMQLLEEVVVQAAMPFEKGLLTPSGAVALELTITDRWGQPWPCGCVALLPVTPGMVRLGCSMAVHRSLFGSFDRFLALALETDGDKVLGAIP